VIVVAHSCVRSWWTAVNGKPAPESYRRYTAAVTAGLRAAHAVVAPSSAMLSALTREYGPFDAPAIVIRNGSELAGSAAPVFRAPKEPFVITAGRAWDEAKNIGAVCEVAPQLPWPVFVAGERRGPDGQGRSLPSVRVLGLLGRAELAATFARASIFALPARYEPFGLSVLEAAAAGCALVLGDIPSLRENWDGAAVFVSADDRQALASAIRTLIADEPRRRELAAEAQVRASGFGIEWTADAYQELYASVCV
jgi:glycosyltransferase involved in cell wall biosynthesis